MQVSCRTVLLSYGTGPAVPGGIASAVFRSLANPPRCGRGVSCSGAADDRRSPAPTRSGISVCVVPPISMSPSTPDSGLTRRHDTTIGRDALDVAEAV